MIFGIDINIRPYASDESSPLHDQAAEFLHQCAGGREVFCLPWLTVMSYVRMAAPRQVAEYQVMKFSITIDCDEDGVWVVQRPSIPGRNTIILSITKGSRVDRRRAFNAHCVTP